MADSEHTTRPLVVGFDGSPSAQDAVRWAAAHAVRTDTPLTVLHAADRIVYAQDEAAGLWDPGTEQQRAVDLAEQGARLAQEEQPDIHVAARGSLLGPRQALDEASARARGVVVGSRGLGRIRSSLLGATAYGITGHARCPVTVVPGASTMPGPQAPVVVGVDGSPESERAAEVAASIAQTWGADLLVVSSWERPTPDPWGMSPDGTRFMEETLELRAEQADQRARDAVGQVATSYPEVSVTTSTPSGRADENLIEASGDAALLVLGHRGSGRLSSFLLGSTTRNILHLSEIPVHIVR
ncbi:universal stress protein [Serinicoccus kebangsaanensis]|uniref:universal stress protein n=1 Tax=Serinicoccus kebangsaanensis TaxID=2602069 RepID=UPI00124D1B63|nr:universal stress protein [Serinicoccus kebangsaanensis]